MLVEYPKVSLNKLKNSSLYNNLLNNYFNIALVVSILFVTIYNIYFIVLFTLIFYPLLKEKKILAYISVGIFFLIGLNLVVRSQISVSLSNTEVVNDVIQYDTYQKIIIQKKTKKIILYDSNMSTIKPGYKITFDYKESSAFGERVEGGFDYNKYLLNNNYLNKTYSITSIDVILCY